MNEVPAVDLAPLLQLLLVGLALASVAIGLLWMRHGRQSAGHWRRTLTVLTLFLTFDLIVFGAFTRLTDSGLGCPDWPGCYGNASPLGAQAEIHAAQTAMPSGPVTHHKAWIEMVHRYLATGVGALITVLAIMGWRAARRQEAAGLSWRGGDPPLGRALPLFTLGWVCLQGAFGALTVTMKLFPAIVTLHLLGGLVLLVLLAVQAERLQREHHGRARVLLGSGSRLWLWFTGGLLWLQVALGGWVSTNYAVLVCTDFPTCHGSLWPEMRFAEGFELWRALGLRGDGQLLSLEALTAIHYTHRLMAYVVLLLLAVVVWRLRGVMELRTPRRWLAGLAALQFLTGLSNVVLGWPLVAALLHTAGAAALMLALTWALASSRASVAAVRYAVPSASPADQSA